MATLSLPWNRRKVKPIRENHQGKQRGREDVLLLHNIFQPGYSWLSLLRSELALLDPRARYSGGRHWKLLLLLPVMLFVAAGLGFIAPSFIWYFTLKWYLTNLQGLIGATALTFSTGGIWLLRKVFERNIIWVFRLLDNGVLGPVMPRFHLSEYASPAKGADGVTRPRVLRSRYLSHLPEGAPYRILVQMLKRSRMDKLQITVLIIMVIALAIVAFFAAVALQKGVE